MGNTRKNGIMDFGIDRIFEVAPWTVAETSFDAARNEASESIFSLANGYMGARGAFDEGFDGPSMEGCYIAGVYVKEKQVYNWKRKCMPDYGNFMTHATNWLRTFITVGDERLDMAHSVIQDYRRELDMRNGLLTRRLTFRTGAGHLTELCWERFISHDDRHLAATRVTVKALNHDQPVQIEFLLDAQKENTYHGNLCRHGVTVRRAAGPDGIELVRRIETTGHHYSHRMSLRSSEADLLKNAAYLNEENEVGCRVAFTPVAGREYTFDRIVSVWTSREAGYPFGLIPKSSDSVKADPGLCERMLNFLKDKSSAHCDSYKDLSYAELKERHIATIHATWDRLDIEIDGDDLSQQGVRYCIFQLFNTYQGQDPYLNIGAKGMTGEWYFGRYFWDSEAYCLPYYLFTDPSSARRLLEYRYNTLDKARERARQFNLKGAWYPWQTIDGSEDLGYWEYSFGEVHINGIIPYAIYNYTRTTGDTSYLYEKGLEVLIEQSRFWASRVSYIPCRSGYGVLKCMGPDEYQQVVDNNYYTNYIAQWTLRYTIASIEGARKNAPEDAARILKKVEFDDTESGLWQEIADMMLLPYDEKLGIFVQDDSFLSLEPSFREHLSKENDIPLEKYWTIDRFQRCDLIKQADVLMMLFLFRDVFSVEQTASNYQFYEQRTIHGSSLSPSVHSILAARIARYHQAYQYYLWASRVDLDDYNNNVYEGLHISSMAGTWMNIVFGFGGVVVEDDALALNPHLPCPWKSLSFKIHFRNRLVEVKMAEDSTMCRLIPEGDGDEAEPLKVKIGGAETLISQTPVAVPAAPRPQQDFEAVVFDLDGVICDTAHYHYKAWKTLADEHGIYFDSRINERLKGVSRMDSLNIVLEKSAKTYSPAEKEAMADTKNRLYREMLKEIAPDNLLPGIEAFLKGLRDDGIKTALYSASRNTDTILERLGIRDLFDEVITGNDVARNKPDPQGFLMAAERLGVQPSACVGVEDAFAGIQAAASAGMKTIGIGYKSDLYNADYVLSSTAYLTKDKLEMLF